jgi:uncharacterized protein (TIGR03492 family)
MRKAVRPKVLFISNGHGEDLNGSLVLKALSQQRPELELAAMPIVGEGTAYRQMGTTIIGPTRNFPSGVFCGNKCKPFGNTVKTAPQFLQPAIL